MIIIFSSFAKMILVLHVLLFPSLIRMRMRCL